MTKSDIHKLFQKTFKSASPPVGAELISKDMEAGTAKRIRDLFSGRRWYELDPEFMIDHADDFWSMEPQARRYYLPAFLLATFHAPKDWVYVNNLVLGLFIPLRGSDDDPDREAFVEFLEMLEPQEKSAVTAFLKFTAENHPSKGEQGAAKMALRVLWRKFSDAA